MKVQLIHCPEKPTGMIEGAWYVPLNLLSVATYLSLNGHKVEILDGQLMTEEEIAQKIDAEFVGFDLMHSSIESFDHLTEMARNKGAITIAGGHLATHLAKEILQENPSVDYVCGLGGEMAFSELLKGKLHPNLAYRGADESLHVPETCALRSTNLRNMPIPDRKITGVNLERHIQLFQADMKKTDLGSLNVRSTNTYFCRGCPYRSAGQGCGFCSRADMVLSRRSAKQAWEEINYLVGTFATKRIVDFSDSFRAIVRPLAEYVLKHGRPWDSLRVYMAVNEVARQGMISSLKVLGVTTVLLGIESADEEVLSLNVAPQKVHTPERVLAVANALAEAGIRIAPAYVLGMRGENESSIQKTLALNCELQNIGTEISYYNNLTPFPGSKSWDDLMEIPGMRQKHGHTYHLNTRELEKDYAFHFTHVSWKRQQEARLELAAGSSTCSFEFVSPEK